MPAEPANAWVKNAGSFAGALLDASLEPPQFLTSARSANDPRRFAVYRNNVTVSLVRALAANFPSLVTLLGEEFFDAMARVHVCEHPPRSRLMFEYGADFPDFLRRFEPVRQYPYLPDVARIEQAWRQAFHAADAQVLSAQTLAAMPQEMLPGVCLVRHPAARLLSSHLAAGSIFTAGRTGASLAGVAATQPETVLVTRPAFDCEVRILDPVNAAFVAALFEGESFETAFAAAAEGGSSFNFEAALTTLLASGAFASIKD